MTAEDNRQSYLDIDYLSYLRTLELSKQGDSYAKRL